MNLHIPDMTCGGCASSIERALRLQDPAVQISADLNQRMVAIQTQLPVAEVLASIQEAGFTPQPVE